jgi:hypothetical protein
MEHDPVGKTTAFALLWQPNWTDIHFQDTSKEIVFVVDRSGSMYSHINQIKRVLSVFVNRLENSRKFLNPSLSAKDSVRFNIIGFGSEYCQLFKESEIYSADTLAVARQHIEGITANLGGTNLLKPLLGTNTHILTINTVAIYEKPPKKGYSRKIIVITDGQVENDSAVIDLVKNHSDINVYSVGIGRDASVSLVDGIATAGNGHAEFISELEAIEIKVFR